MPEYPHNARILTPVQRDLAVWRLEQEAGAGEAHEDISNLKAYLSALKDPKVGQAWLCLSPMSYGRWLSRIVRSTAWSPA
jgi:hypothetical protein